MLYNAKASEESRHDRPLYSRRPGRKPDCHRPFARRAAGVRGRGETRLSVAISGARNPVPVEIEPASGRAYAQMPLPCALDRLCVDGRDIPLVRMEGIDHALLLNEAPSPELAERVLAA